MNKAQRLANLLVFSGTPSATNLEAEAAALLRQQDEALRLALWALEYHTAQTRPIHQTLEAIAKIKEWLHD